MKIKRTSNKISLFTQVENSTCDFAIASVYFYAYHILNKFPFPIADTRHICLVFNETKNEKLSI